MRALLAPAAALLALAGPVALTPQASAESTTLKAVIFEEVKPLYHKTDAGYEGLGVDVLEQIRIQAKRRKVDYRVAKSVNDGIGANKPTSLQATGFSYPDPHAVRSGLPLIAQRLLRRVLMATA